MNLLQACKSQDKFLIKEILKTTNINQKYEEDKTILHLCVENNVNPKIVKFLINSGADIYARATSRGYTSFDCIQNDNLDLAKCFLVNNKLPKLLIKGDDNLKTYPLNISAVRNHVKIVKLLLDQDDINVNTIDPTNCSPLRCNLLMDGDFEIIKRLLIAGCDPTGIKNYEDTTELIKKYKKYKNIIHKWNIELNPDLFLYVITILYNSEYLTTQDKILKKYFYITSLLPIELVMRITHLTFDSTDIFISSHKFEKMLTSFKFYFIEHNFLNLLKNIFRT